MIIKATKKPVDNQSQKDKLLMMFIKSAYTQNVPRNKKLGLELMKFVAGDNELNRLINIGDWKSVLNYSSIEPVKESEWKNGDKCFYMNSSVEHTIIGRDDKFKDSFWCKSTCGNINRLEENCLIKPPVTEGE